MKRILAMALAVVMIVGVSVVGTMAWLQDKTDPVTNTFTVGDIDIDLKEHALNVATNELNQGVLTDKEENYKIVPGDVQPKDPFVRFVDDSEPCWLFVKIEEKNNAVAGKNYKYVTYTVDTVDAGWTALDDNPGVYYKELKDLTATGTELNILAGDQVSYDENLTKEDLDKVTDDTKPQLIFTAYAVQWEAATSATDAWTLANPTT